MSERRHINVYRRHGLSLERLRAAIQADPAIRAETEVELKAVEPFAEGGIHYGRCVVSKEYAAILRKALMP